MHEWSNRAPRSFSVWGMVASYACRRSLGLSRNLRTPTCGRKFAWRAQIMYEILGCKRQRLTPCFLNVTLPLQEATQGDSLRTSGKRLSSIALWDGGCLLLLLPCALSWTSQDLCILDMVCKWKLNGWKNRKTKKQFQLGVANMNRGHIGHLNGGRVAEWLGRWT